MARGQASPAESEGASDSKAEVSWSRRGDILKPLALKPVSVGAPKSFSVFAAVDPENDMCNHISLGQVQDQISLLLDILQEPSDCESCSELSSQPSDTCTQESLQGSWLDSQGNSVYVYQNDASSLNLTATMSKAGRLDRHMGVWKAPGEGIWHCGDATLDTGSSSRDSVTWKFWRGNKSVWTREQESCQIPNSCTYSETQVRPNPYTSAAKKRPPDMIGSTSWSDSCGQSPAAFQWGTNVASCVPWNYAVQPGMIMQPIVVPMVMMLAPQRQPYASKNPLRGKHDVLAKQIMRCARSEVSC